MVLKINNSTAKIYIQTEVCKKIIKKFAHANAFFFNGIIYCIGNKNPLLYILHEIDTVYDTTSTMQSSLITTKKNAITSGLQSCRLQCVLVLL